MSSLLSVPKDVRDVVLSCGLVVISIPNRMEEFEKEPAYKRLGIDITTNPQDNTTSRTSFGTDSNDDIQLRSNNSFLHDNVD